MIKLHFMMKRTIVVGAATLLSRFCGLVRDILLARYIGVGASADAFFAAFLIPNSLRKIFAEGALSASFIPTIVSVVHTDGQKAADRCMTGLFLVIQTILFMLCAFLAVHADVLMRFAAPGWFIAGSSMEPYAELGIALARILVFFIMLLSSMSLLTGALQAVGRFAVPAFSQVLLNLFWIVLLCLALAWGFTLPMVAYGILAIGILLVLIYTLYFYYAGFRFRFPDASARDHVRKILHKFLPCLISVGALELNLYIDSMLVSFLPAGGRSILYYASTYMRIPLGVVAVAFASIALPYFTKVAVRTPRRLHFYVFESLKFMWWIMIPASCLMTFFARDIFATMLLSSQFPMEAVIQASHVLMVYCWGLFFFSCNKVLVNVFSALHQTFLPGLIALSCTVINTVLSWVLMGYCGVVGIVAATVISSAVHMLLLLYCLRRYAQVRLNVRRLLHFFVLNLWHVSLVGSLFYLVYATIMRGITLLPSSLAYIVQATPVYWLWVVPLVGGGLGLLYLLSSAKRASLYFLPHK